MQSSQPAPRRRPLRPPRKYIPCIMCGRVKYVYKETRTCAKCKAIAEARNEFLYMLDMLESAQWKAKIGKGIGKKINDFVVQVKINKKSSVLYFLEKYR